MSQSEGLALFDRADKDDIRPDILDIPPPVLTQGAAPRLSMPVVPQAPALSMLSRSIEEQTPLSFGRLLGIAHSPISKAVQGTWLEILECMSQDPELYEINLKNIFQAHRMPFEDLEKMIAGYFNKAHATNAQYLRQRYPGDPDIQKMRDYLPEIKNITSIMEALHVLYASKYALQKYKKTHRHEQRVYHLRLIHESMQVLAHMLNIREIVKSPQIMNRAEDSHYFEHTLLHENLGMIPDIEKIEAIEVRFQATATSRNVIVYLPEDRGYDNLPEGDYQSVRLYRMTMTGRTSMKSLDRETVEIFCFPGSGENSKRNSIMNFKKDESLALKKIRNAIDAHEGTERDGKPIFDSLRTTIMTLDEQSLKKATAMIETELASTINTKKAQASRKGSSDAYTADQRTLWLTNEERSGRQFYVEIRLEELRKLLLIESEGHDAGQQEFKRRAMTKLDPYLRPAHLYGEAK